MDESATATYRSLIGYTERGPCPVSMECTFAVADVRRDRRGRRHLIIVIIIVGVYLLCREGVYDMFSFYCNQFIPNKQIISNPARDMDNNMLALLINDV